MSRGLGDVYKRQAWTGVVGKAVTTVARAKKPVHNRFHVFFINLMLLSFWVIK